VAETPIRQKEPLATIAREGGVVADNGVRSPLTIAHRRRVFTDAEAQSGLAWRERTRTTTRVGPAACSSGSPKLSPPSHSRWWILDSLLLPHQDVDGSLPAGLAGVRLLVELHALTDAELLESIALHARSIEQDLYVGVVRLDESVSALLDKPFDVTRRHSGDSVRAVICQDVVLTIQYTWTGGGGGSPNRLGILSLVSSTRRPRTRYGDQPSAGPGAVHRSQRGAAVFAMQQRIFVAFR
jgi:hypothetical protein